jgi:hypothetical protein
MDDVVVYFGGGGILWVCFHGNPKILKNAHFEHLKLN